LKEAGGQRPPASLRSSPLSAIHGILECSFPAECPVPSLGALREGQEAVSPRRPFAPRANARRAPARTGVLRPACTCAALDAAQATGVRPKAPRRASDLLVELPRWDTR